MKSTTTQRMVGLAAVAIFLTITLMGLPTSNEEERAKLDSMSAEFDHLRARAEEPGCGLQLDFGPVKGVEEVLNAITAKPSWSGTTYLEARIEDLRRLIDAYILNVQLVCSTADALSREVESVSEEASAASAAFDSVFSALKPADNRWTSYGRFLKWYNAQGWSDWERIRTESKSGLHVSSIQGTTPRALYALTQNINLSPSGSEYSVQYRQKDDGSCHWKYFLWRRYNYRWYAEYTDISGAGTFTYSRGPVSSDRRTCEGPVPTRRGTDRPLPSLMSQLSYALERDASRACREIVSDPKALGRLFAVHRPDGAGTRRLYDHAAEEATLTILAEGEQICRLQNIAALRGLLDGAVATAYRELIGPREDVTKLARARAQFVVDQLSRTLVDELATGPFEIDMGGAP